MWVMASQHQGSNSPSGRQPLASGPLARSSNELVHLPVLLKLACRLLGAAGQGQGLLRPVTASPAGSVGTWRLDVGGPPTLPPFLSFTCAAIDQPAIALARVPLPRKSGYFGVGFAGGGLALPGGGGRRRGRLAPWHSRRGQSGRSCRGLTASTVKSQGPGAADHTVAWGTGAGRTCTGTGTHLLFVRIYHYC